ncbi:MAG: hypothetical protein AAFN74_02225 [Myxococcota bacterium]
MVKSQFFARDQGLGLMLEQVRNAGDLVLRTGILTNEAHRNGDGLTVADVASIQEFGSADGRIPSRPAFRQAIANNREAIVARLREELTAMAEGKQTPRQALGRTGLEIQAAIRKRITDLKTPPNAPSTVQRKKSANPLIDTGQLRQSVSFELVSRKKVDPT